MKRSTMLTPNAMVRAVIQFHTTVTMMKWWPKYAERNVQWLNITFIFIMFQNKISYSVSISCLSSFSHLMEDTEKIIFIKEEISLKIKKIICIKRCNLNFRSLLLYFHEVFNWQILCVSSVRRCLSWTMPQRERCYMGLPVKYLKKGI